MSETDRTGGGLWLYERNDAVVIEAFRRGEFDYLEGAQEVNEADFFRAIARWQVLAKLAASYPTPREKHDVPLWVYLASDLSMRFHGEHHYHALPYVVRVGGLVQAFGPEMGQKVTHPETGDVTLRCEGFNDKNGYDRETPCDQDYVRKLARDTPAQALERWFNESVVGVFKQHHAFDAEGIFIGDATYLFVPDNPKYEGSSLLLFDEDDHPVDSERYAQMTPEQQARCQWRRCYKLVSLLHTNRRGEFFLYGGLRVVAGRDHESPILYQMVRDFVQYHGRSVMKRLIVDRGFIDGPEIGHCKKELQVDVLIPAKQSMDVYKDVVGMAEGGLLQFQPYEAAVAAPAATAAPVHVPERIRKREAARQKTLQERKARAAATVATAPVAQKSAPRPRTAKAKATRLVRPNPAAAPRPPAKPQRVRSEMAVVANLETFTTCPVPVHALVNREYYDDGHHEYWVLLDTAPISDPKAKRQEYGLRGTIEERHRQTKCFSDLEAFTSRTLNLVVHQVVLVLLTYSLLQWYLVRQGRKDLTRQTQPRVLERLQPTQTVILLYYKNYVAYLTPLQHQELVLTLSAAARKKILAKTRRLRRSLAHVFTKPRPL
jgi:hypothetical protein